MGNQTIPLQNVTASRSTKRSTKQPPGQKPSAPHHKSHQKVTAKRSGLQFLLYFAQRHPFVCLFAVWGSMLFFGWLALTGLTHINTAPLEVAKSPQPEAVVESERSRSELSKPANTLGLSAIVAASCATASVLLARRLRPAKPPSRRALRRQSARTPETGRTPEATKRSTRPRRPIVEPANMPPAIPARPPTRSSAMKVLPNQENLLDMNDASLADLLDIRQQARR